MFQNVNKIIFPFFGLIVIANLLLGGLIFFEFQDHKLEFYVFDVGQGDAMLIRTPNRIDILIDGGPDNSVVYKLGKYLPFYDRTIDLMILSHPHADHINGLIEVMKRYQVKHILTTGIVYASPQYRVWQEQISKNNITVQIIESPRIISLDKDVYLNIIFPDQSFLDKKIKNLNNASIVVQLIYGDTSVMLTGDLEEEELLVNQNLDLKSDILKVGHHGSDNANDIEFLKNVNPTYATISAGTDNKFGHPHQQTLANLLQVGAQILRTDLLGDLIFESDGHNFMYLSNMD